MSPNPGDQIQDILVANAQFAAAFDGADLAARPAQALAVVTCMDARLDPAAFLGLGTGDAHVLRNAGGLVTEDILRSLAISHHVLGTRQALVVGHTECGLLTQSDDDIRGRIGAHAAGADFLAFNDLETRICESVRAIEASTLLPETFSATGFVFDVRTGRLREVST